MQKFEEDDIDSQQSDDLRDEEIIAMNRHLRNRRPVRNSKMGAEAEEIYKQALMHTIFGRFQQASKCLKKCITLQPDNPDAYHLFGTIYEETHEEKNAVEYFLMSAYLSPPNFEKWKKVGTLSFDLKMYDQAAYCFGRALKIENYNIQIMAKRAEAFQNAHQSRKAISTYKKILQITFSLPILKQYARLRFKRDEYKTARQILTEYANHQKDPHTAYMICETFLKQDNFQELLKYLQGFIQAQKNEEQGQFSIESINIQFLIFLYISMVRLKRSFYQPLKVSLDEVKKILLESYEQSYEKEYELLISYFKSDEQALKQTITFLIKHKPHKIVQNYLLYTQFLKKQSKYDEAIAVLNEGLSIHKNSVQLTSQLNHIKVVSGNWKNNKRGLTIDFKKQIAKNQTQNIDDIFYSDQQNNNEMQESIFEVNNLSEKDNKQKQTQQRKPNKSQQPKVIQSNSIETQDPEIIKRLLNNCNQTLASIVSYQTQNFSSCFKQVEDCIVFVLNLTSLSKTKEQEEKQGLFYKNYRRRRYFSSKQSSRQQFILDNSKTIFSILDKIIQFMKSLLEQHQFHKAKLLAQMLSKAYFFRWQNKSLQLKRIKKILYQIGLLACLCLKKYQTAVFFIKYLAHRQPDNSFYLLIVNYLIHNSNTKISMSSLLGKYIGRSNMPNNSKTSEKSQEEQMKQSDENFFEDNEESDNLSYPRKMSNISNISDFLRDNVKLNFLFGIEYMETGCFDLAISSFLKVINQSSGEIRRTIWLCLSSCFMQITSSRTCHSKLPNTNTSTYCFWQYLCQTKDSIQRLFNKARFFAQLRINQKAITFFKLILEMKELNEEQEQIQIKAAHCLMCIYKDVQDWDMVNKISQKYFAINSGKNQMDVQ